MMSIVVRSCIALTKSAPHSGYLSRLRGRERAAHAARPSSHPLRIEHGLLARAVAAQCALFADGVGALEDPVLPGREPGKDLRFHGFRPAEAKVRLQAGEAVWREARALLEEDADLVLPVDVVEREGDEAEFCRSLGTEFSAGRLADCFEGLRLAEKPRGEPRETIAHRQAAMACLADNDRR